MGRTATEHPSGPHGGTTTITPSGLRRVVVTLDPDTIARLDNLAAILKTTRSGLIRRMARQYSDVVDRAAAVAPVYTSDTPTA